MRTLVAALQVSVDGFIEGPNGELDWALAEDEETWRDIFEMLESVDTCILGPVMHPDYEQHWLAALANPTGLCHSARVLDQVSGFGPSRSRSKDSKNRWRWGVEVLPFAACLRESNVS